jgi:hypothetical protein
MLSNDLLQVRIRGVRILLEQRTDLAVIGCEHVPSIIRLVYGLVAVGSVSAYHEAFSFHLSLSNDIPLTASDTKA